MLNSNGPQTQADRDAIAEAVPDKVACRAPSPDDAWICTRPPDHDGEHIAVMMDGDCSDRSTAEVVERWPAETARAG